MKYSLYSQEKDKASPLSLLKITHDVLHNDIFKIRGHQKKECLKKYHCQEQAKETWHLNVIQCSVWDNGTEKQHERKVFKSFSKTKDFSD